MTTPLPEFSNPPVNEVVLGIQFASDRNFDILQFGSIVDRFRDQFPKMEEHPPLESEIERFGQASNTTDIPLHFFSPPTFPRIWLIDSSGSELLQIQQDRFIRNWRRTDPGTPYPRFNNLRREFLDSFKIFDETAKKAGCKPLVPNQCEVSYVNIFRLDGHSDPHGELGRFITMFDLNYSDEGPGVPEKVSLNLQYVLSDKNREPIGRLRIACSPVVSTDGNNIPGVQTVLVARGRPATPDIEGVMKFIDFGHQAVVRTFASITTPEMHKAWGRSI